MTTAGAAPVLAAIATGVQVGLAIVATRFVVGEAGPASLAFFRYTIGFVCLLPVAWRAGLFPFARRDVVPVALLGIGQFGVLIALLNFALQHIPAARAALVFALLPLLSLLLGGLTGRDRLTPARAAGVMLSIAGVALALAGDVALSASVAGTPWLGDLAAFGAALTGAICSVFYRPYLERYPTVSVGAFAMLASVFVLALLSIPEGLFAAARAFTTPGWSAVLFIGASSGVGYFLWLHALRHAPPTNVTIFLGLSPVTAAVGGWVLLGEPLGLATLAGLAVVLAGLWLALRP